MQIANRKLQIANWSCIAALLALALAGCTSAVQSGHNTLLDSMDLVQMTDQMARSIVAWRSCTCTTLSTAA